MSGMKYGEKSFVYNFLKPWLGDGLLVSNGNKLLCTFEYTNNGYKYKPPRHIPDSTKCQKQKKIQVAFRH